MANFEIRVTAQKSILDAIEPESIFGLLEGMLAARLIEKDG
jgi:hypothetical protein